MNNNDAPVVWRDGPYTDDKNNITLATSLPLVQGMNAFHTVDVSFHATDASFLFY